MAVYTYITSAPTLMYIDITRPVMAVATDITSARGGSRGQVSSDAKAIMRCIERKSLPFPEREPHGAVTPTSASEHARIVK